MLLPKTIFLLKLFLALISYRPLLATENPAAKAAYEKGQALAEKGDFEAALEAIKLDPNYAEHHRLRMAK